MPINKVIYDEKTLIDISDSTVSTDNMLEGKVAYSASGDKIYGLMQGIRLEDPVDAESILGKIMSMIYVSPWLPSIFSVIV